MVEHPAAAADIWQERYRAATVLAGFEPSSRSEADMPIHDPLRSGDFAVVMEMENAIFISWSEVGETLRVVAAQVGEVLTAGQARLPQVIFVHAGEHGESAELLEGVRREAPRLFDVADVQCVSVPDGRYYELKNAGLAAAARDVIVLLDSDTIPEAGWLRELVAPFADEGTIAASGHTYLGHSTFVSRTLAMVWVFPLRDHDAGAAQRRALNVNNCALRAAWFRAHPFPIDHGFKVSCTKFMRQMNVNGVALLRPPAYAKHAPLTGWRFLVWRALVTGRDADRKYTDMKSASRFMRMLHAVRFLWKMECRTIRRVVAHHRHVALPPREIPAALVVGCGFYALAFLGQTARLLGLTTDGPELVPAYAEHH
jgi:hypothetical protein